MNHVKRGFYLHYKGDFYFVTSVGTTDEVGHGNANGPRMVGYESTKSVEDGMTRFHTEEDFTTPVLWPDGNIRPRFHFIYGWDGNIKNMVDYAVKLLTPKDSESSR